MLIRHHSGDHNLSACVPSTFRSQHKLDVTYLKDPIPSSWARLFCIRSLLESFAVLGKFGDFGGGLIHSFIMRIINSGLLLWSLSLLTPVSGFPGAGSGLNGHSVHQGMHKPCPYANLQAQGQSQGKAEHQKRFLFSLMKKPVDSMRQEHPCAVSSSNIATIVTGEHKFQPPNFENGDQRGPCPGLNALANHGYIPRSGVVSVG